MWNLPPNAPPPPPPPTAAVPPRPNLLPNDGSFMSQFKHMAQEKQPEADSDLEESMKQFLSEVGATSMLGGSSAPASTPSTTAAVTKGEALEAKTREPIKRRSRRSIKSASSSTSSRTVKIGSMTGIEAALRDGTEPEPSTTTQDIKGAIAKARALASKLKGTAPEPDAAVRSVDISKTLPEPEISAQGSGPDMARAVEAAKAAAARLQKQMNISSAAQAALGAAPGRRRRSRWGAEAPRSEVSASLQGSGITDIEGGAEKKARHGEKNETGEDDDVDIGFLERQLEAAKRHGGSKGEKSRSAWEEDLARESREHLEDLAKGNEALHHARDTFEDAEQALANGTGLEGGSWEHRSRAAEMLATADSTHKLAANERRAKESNAGSSLLSYLPKDVEAAFLKDAQEKGVKLTPDQVRILAATKSNAGSAGIGSDNIGFQMLAKIGGTAAAPSSDSRMGEIAVPVGPKDTAVQGPAGAGVGVEATHEVKEGDDEFDTFRKRMMLAYRYRPNPLNNPRRHYY